MCLHPGDANSPHSLGEPSSVMSFSDEFVCLRGAGSRASPGALDVSMSSIPMNEGRAKITPSEEEAPWDPKENIRLLEAPARAGRREGPGASSGTGSPMLLLRSIAASSSVVNE